MTFALMSVHVSVNMYSHKGLHARMLFTVTPKLPCVRTALSSSEANHWGIINSIILGTEII